MSRKVPVITLPDVPNLDEIAEAFDTALPTSFEPPPIAGEKKNQTPAQAIALHRSEMTLRRRAQRRRILDATMVKAASDQIGALPANEETIHVLLGGDFHAWTFVPTIQRQAARPLDEVVIATLGFSHANIYSLCQMLDAGQIKSAAILCSHYFKNADADIYENAQDRIRERRQRIGAARNHAKLILISAGAARYVIEGSANLRSCGNFEQAAITRSRPLYDFHRRWILRVLDSVGA